MVRKIKAYNKKKIRVRTDGKMKPMHFKKALAAIKKSHKAYFAEDGHVELESFAYSHRNDDKSGATKPKSFGISNEPITHDQRIRASK